MFYGLIGYRNKIESQVLCVAALHAGQLYKFEQFLEKMTYRDSTEKDVIVLHACKEAQNLDWAHAYVKSTEQQRKLSPIALHTYLNMLASTQQGEMSPRPGFRAKTYAAYLKESG